ncbi:MAG: iron ABC transporter permease [Betaproteobacteria bacterium]|nr:iron ABC transporter permease [Betaproteobacteria bacterium]MDH3438510.1 iron ABC transporter permease [Betaproteobacteria bacterium]
MSRPLALGTALVVAAVASVFLALVAGPFPISARQVLDSVLFPIPGLVHDIIWQLRAPRALAAFACGGLLALAGALLQALLRNALADPYVLGVSSGAALGALLALVAGAGVALMSMAALAGAACAIAIVFGLSFRSGEWDIYRLLLTGVVLAAGFSALVSLTLVTASHMQVKGMLFWLMGDLSYADSPLAAWIVLLFGTALATSGARGLDLLALGETKARSLGLPVKALQVGIFAVAAAATVAAVMLAGSVGFVGLMVPHAVRLMGVAAYRWLLPLSVLLGGVFLTVADTVARTLVAPQQLPVGVLTAIIGVPLMLWLLGRRRLTT